MLKTRYLVDIPTLHEEVERAARLQKPGLAEPEKEKAQFNLAWASNPGTPVFVAAVLSALFLRMNGAADGPRDPADVHPDEGADPDHRAACWA